MRFRLPRHAFTLLELMVCLVIISLLLGVLLPLLALARDGAHKAVCAANLKNIGLAWQQYLNEHEAFPALESLPEWHYGGVVFTWPEQRPKLAIHRPLNQYLTPNINPKDTRDESARLAEIYRCPSDTGLVSHDHAGAGTSFPIGDNTCFENFGNSYRGNSDLLAHAAPNEQPGAAVRVSEITVPTTRLILVGDAEWYYATRPAGAREATYDASWHRKDNAGNACFVDGSVQFLEFVRGETRQYLFKPMR